MTIVYDLKTSVSQFSIGLHVHVHVLTFTVNTYSTDNVFVVILSYTVRISIVFFNAYRWYVNDIILSYRISYVLLI